MFDESINAFYFSKNIRKLKHCMKIDNLKAEYYFNIKQTAMIDNPFIPETFRCSFPSPVPVRSPSPDLKNSNKLKNTLSPAFHSRRQQPTSPHKQTASFQCKSQHKQTEQPKQYSKLQFEIGGGTFSNEEIAKLKRRISEQDKVIVSYRNKEEDRVGEASRTFLSEFGNVEEYKQRIFQKDKIIFELKKIIGNLSGSVQHQYSTSFTGQEQLLQKIRTLEFQNERLGEIAQRVTKKQGKEGDNRTASEVKTLTAKVQQLTMENHELQQKIQRLRKVENDDSLDISKSSQAKLILVLEQQNKGLERQNDRLMRLLKQSKDSQRNLKNQKNSEEQIERLQAEIKILKEKHPPEKLSIVKIKQQYNQNLKMFKQTVYGQVSRQFEKFEDTVKSLHYKLQELEQKTDRINSARVSSHEVSPQPFVKISKSERSHQYDSPLPETGKKGSTQPKLFEATKLKETKSEITDPEVYRLQMEVETHRKQRGELQEKYEKLQSEYRILKEEHQNSLNEIQKFVTKITELREALDRANSQAKSQRGKERNFFSEKKSDERGESRQIDSTIELEKIKKKHEAELKQLRAETKDQVSRIVDTYKQEITVLRQNIDRKAEEFAELLKTVKYREQKQQIEIAQKQNQINQLRSQITESKQIIQTTQARIEITQIARKQVEEVAQTRKRSYTLLENNYHELLVKYNTLESQKNELFNQLDEQMCKYQRETSQQVTIVQGLQDKIGKLNDQIEKNEHIAQNNKDLRNQNKILKEQIENIREMLGVSKEEREQLEIKINDLIRQSQSIKESLQDANTDQIISMVGQLTSKKMSLTAKIETVLQQSQSNQLKLKSQIAELQRQNKLLNLKLETTEKQLEIRLAETVTLCNLLEQHVKESQKNTEKITTTTTVFQSQLFTQTDEIRKIQTNYTQSVAKLEKLIKDLEHLRNQPSRYD